MTWASSPSWPRKINVMYAGYIIERGDVRDIYKHTRHPYTLGLLGSLPRLDEAPGTKLVSIPGLPPDLVALPKGCPFVARCIYRVEQCKEESPPLEDAEDWIIRSPAGAGKTSPEGQPA